MNFKQPIKLPKLTGLSMSYSHTAKQVRCQVDFINRHGDDNCVIHLKNLEGSGMTYEMICQDLLIAVLSEVSYYA